MARSSVILLSGGLRSAVAAAGLRDGNVINALHLRYSYAASERSRAAAAAQTSKLMAERTLELDLPHVPVLLEQHRSQNSLTNLPGSGEFHTLPASLPCLLPTILCAAVDWAARIRADAVVIGSSWIGQRDANGRVILGDDPSLDRIRPTIHAFKYLMESRLPKNMNIALETPLMDLSLEEVVKLGQRYEVSFDKTWSCETGAVLPCTKCPGCIDRKTAFAQADIIDPLAVARAAVGAR